jgi:hypothetical protein
VHGFHYSGDHITPPENALVGHQVKTLLSPIEDYAPTRRLIVFRIRWYGSVALEPSPVVDVAGGMTQGGAVRFCHGERRGVEDELIVKEPENANVGFRLLYGFLHHKCLLMLLNRIIDGLMIDRNCLISSIATS